MTSADGSKPGFFERSENFFRPIFKAVVTLGLAGMVLATPPTFMRQTLRLFGNQKVRDDLGVTSGDNRIDVVTQTMAEIKENVGFKPELSGKGQAVEVASTAVTLGGVLTVASMLSGGLFNFIYPGGKSL